MAENATATTRDWFKWILAFLITLWMAISGYAVKRIDCIQGDLAVLQRALPEKYVSKEDYRIDTREMRADLKEIKALIVAHMSKK